MDNFHFALTNESHSTLEMALRLLFQRSPSQKATHYTVTRLTKETRYYAHEAKEQHAANVDLSRIKGNTLQLHLHHFTETKVADKGDETLILHWGFDKGSDRQGIPFAFPHDVEDAIAFVKGWLKHADPGPQPDHDGDNKRGFHIWGEVQGFSYGICAIQSTWAMYGK